MTESRRRWLEANKDKIREKQRAYDAARAHERRGTPEGRRAATRRYRERNPDKIKESSARYYAGNRDAVRKRCSEYRKSNKAYFAARNSKRKAWQLKATPRWANDDAIRRIYDAAAENGLSVDHIVPLKSKIVCGLHCEANLQLIPLADNILKNNRHWPDMP